MVKIVLISASSRASSASLKLAGEIQSRLESVPAGVTLVDMHRLSLPIYGSLLADDGWSQRLEVVLTALDQADGLVVVVPEWNGSANPSWLNLTFYAGDRLAHKPVLPVAVSAGLGGSYPLTGLRSFGHKDCRYLMIPESLIVRQVDQAFNDQGRLAADLAIKLDYVLAVLLQYSQSLQALRASSVIRNRPYSAGF